MYKSNTIDNIPSINAPKILKPLYAEKGITEPSPDVKKLAKDHHLIQHQEGGYFNETDRSSFLMENPSYPGHNDGTKLANVTRTGDFQNEPILPHPTDSTKKITPTRNYSTLIHYLITCESPLGRLHMNEARIIHILQKGRGQYVLVYPDGTIKSFVVGFNTDKGEVNQWVVPGGVYKASFLLPLDSDDQAHESSKDHLLISEVVVPGFEYDGHTFARKDDLVKLVGNEKANELSWLLGGEYFNK
ncbi:unnamed protein product [Ambrosiozyma monospora]|uniref:Unnamed protein product n=1 Tax=Ambrosiozyma monospora TaxID=43982 RepID=A0A9W7DJJ6_AMBMO|nr:unnamed protein product [Ambrosiozyma monospora]